MVSFNKPKVKFDIPESSYDFDLPDGIELEAVADEMCSASKDDIQAPLTLTKEGSDLLDISVKPLSRIQKIKKAAEVFCENAPSDVQSKVAELGGKIAERLGKTYDTPKEQIEIVLNTADACRAKEMKTPLVKKFIDSVNKFIDWIAKKSHNIAEIPKKIFGKFSKKAVDEKAAQSVSGHQKD